MTTTPFPPCHPPSSMYQQTAGKIDELHTPTPMAAGNHCICIWASVLHGDCNCCQLQDYAFFLSFFLKRKYFKSFEIWFCLRDCWFVWSLIFVCTVWSSEEMVSVQWCQFNYWQLQDFAFVGSYFRATNSVTILILLVYRLRQTTCKKLYWVPIFLYSYTILRVSFYMCVLNFFWHHLFPSLVVHVHVTNEDISLWCDCKTSAKWHLIVTHFISVLSYYSDLSSLGYILSAHIMSPSCLFFRRYLRLNHV